MSAKDLTTNLQRRIFKLQKLERVFSARLESWQNARLMTGVLFFVAIFVAALKPSLHIEVVAIPVFIFAFSFLVWRTRRLDRFVVRLRALKEFCERQKNRRLGQAVQRDWEAALKALPADADRTAISDLNLIGPHSLFTLIDETVSDGGRRELVSELLESKLTREQILNRQSHVQSLARARWFFTRLLIAASETNLKLSTHSALEFLQKPFTPMLQKNSDEPAVARFSRSFGGPGPHVFDFTCSSTTGKAQNAPVLAAKARLKRFVSNSFATLGFTEKKGGLLAAGMSLLWVLCIAGTIWAAQTEAVSPAFFITAFLATSLFAAQKIGPVFLRGVGLAHHLSALVHLLARLEDRADLKGLQEIMPTVLRVRPSQQLKRFSFVLGFLGAETHPFLYILLNAIFPWAVVFSWLLERERRRLAADFPHCLDEFHRLEVMFSLVFLYSYQTSTFPQISTQSEFKFSRLLHPLISRERAVSNDFSFPDDKTLGLITGSNMSGKSTFLRTLGVNQTLANMGAPVFAASFGTTVFQIGTCIQVSDSLRDGFSYFYAEVLRLKKLTESVLNGRPVLFLIDEIFRGTNNRERQIGSRAVIRSLSAVSANASRGFVSTHDLELVNLEESLKPVMNLHFREEIQGDEMTFSYKLQKGPCPTTNALKIMTNLGLDLSGL